MNRRRPRQKTPFLEEHERIPVAQDQDGPQLEVEPMALPGVRTLF